MTKMRSKKMTKSTFAVIIMAILMVAMLAFGGTYAYFTAEAKGAANGTATTGTLTMGGTMAVTSVEKLVPNQSAEVVNTANVTVTGTTIAAYRARVEILSIKKGDATFTDSSNYIKLQVLKTGVDGNPDTLDSAWTESTDKDGWLYFNQVKKGETVGTMSTIANKVVLSLDKAADDTYQGLTITYTVVFQAAQAEYHESDTTGAWKVENAAITADQAQDLAWATYVPVA